MKTRLLTLIAALALVPGILAAQDAETGDDATEQTAPEPAQTSAAGGNSFGMAVAFGVNTFENENTGEIETYQLLAIRPELVLGPFGIGLDLAINYRFTGGNGDEFEVREEDWVPDSDTTFLELYLPKFRYIRYNEKGDPLFVRFGSFSDSTLGNGFIVNRYSNELYLPERRIFGANLDVDGQLFDFPFLGIETMVGNVAVWDVLAARLYTRPLAATGIPIVNSLQIGSTLAVDRDPFYHLKKDPASPYSDDYEDGPQLDAPDDTVSMWGVDMRLPLLSSEIISLATFADLVNQNGNYGGMVGAGGRLVGFLLYGAQIRALEDNFIPSYFDTTYDVRRAERFFTYEEDIPLSGGVGWLGRLGFSMLGDGIIFDTTLSGPFDPGADSGYPELQTSLIVAEGIVPGFTGLSLEGYYNKFDLRSWDDLVSAEDALIGARVNVRSGPAIITLRYDVVYDPFADGNDKWTVSSGLESSISF